MFVDLSHDIEPSTQVYPGDPLFRKEPFATIAKDGYSVQELHMGTHTGTHIDAPTHFRFAGLSIDEVDPSVLVGPALVVDVSYLGSREEITLAHVYGYLDKIPGYRIVLFRTGWSQYWKTPKYLEHPYISAVIAEKLLLLGVKVIGVDALSPDITPSDGEEGDYAVHETFLGKGRFIVENLRNLEELEGRSMVVSLLPLRIVDGDGSPIRAVAWEKGMF